MITKSVPALLCAPTGHNPTSRTTPELATALVGTGPVSGATTSGDALEGLAGKLECLCWG